MFGACVSKAFSPATSRSPAPVKRWWAKRPHPPCWRETTSGIRPGPAMASPTNATRRPSASTRYASEPSVCPGMATAVTRAGPKARDSPAATGRQGATLRADCGGCGRAW